MAGFFPQEWLDEVLARNNIVDVVSAYTPLTKKGKKHWGLCPFHSEKTPSFSVDEDKQLYYCFGCKAGGNMIHFVMNLEKLNFREAVVHLAERVGMEPPELQNNDEADRIRKEKQRLYELCREAAKAYNMALMTQSGTQAREYLSNRGITPAVITRFGLGYADASWDSMTNYLLKKGYTLNEIEKSGLCIVRGGRKFDFFRDRVIFPIIDQYGKVLGFGGRVIKGDGPKYINSPDTPIYNKRHMLYGLNFHKKFPQSRELIVVEGYMDLISVSSIGLSGVVASLGTSLTKEQARLMRRFADRVYICYDGDFAGQTATLRGLEILDSEGLDVRVVSLPDGLDPDDFVKKYGPVGMRDAMDKAYTLMEFKLEMLKRELDMTTENGLMEFAKRGAAMVRTLEPVEAERYLKRIARMTGFSMQSLTRQTTAGGSKEQQPGYRRLKQEEAAVSTTEPLLIALCLNSSQCCEEALKYIGHEDLSIPLHREIWQQIEELGSENATPQEVMLRLQSGEDAAALTGMLQQDVGDLRSRQGVQDLCIRVLMAKYLGQLSAQYEKLKSAAGEERKEVLYRIAALNDSINQLKKGNIPTRRSHR
ncbi:MAG: DNA primase [Clostridiales bacterium]|nr:DNA primase [Clostridiales bacterium]